MTAPEDKWAELLQTKLGGLEDKRPLVRTGTLLLGAFIGAVASSQDDGESAEQARSFSKGCIEAAAAELQGPALRADLKAWVSSLMKNSGRAGT